MSLVDTLYPAYSKFSNQKTRNVNTALYATHRNSILYFVPWIKVKSDFESRSD